MSIPEFTVLPSINAPDNFETAMETFVQTELPAFATAANVLAAGMGAIAAGGAFAIPYTFSTTTTDSDPGAGILRLDNATQNAATTIRADLTGGDGNDWTSVLATFDDSTSTIKGHIRLVKLADATKWLLFEVTALATPAGYRNITVACIGSSAASPFASSDSLVLCFSRNGDIGAVSPAFEIISTATITLSAASVSVQTPSGYADLRLYIEDLSYNTQGGTVNLYKNTTATAGFVDCMWETLTITPNCGLANCADMAVQTSAGASNNVSALVTKNSIQCAGIVGGHSNLAVIIEGVSGNDFQEVTLELESTYKNNSAAVPSGAYRRSRERAQALYKSTAKMTAIVLAGAQVFGGGTITLVGRRKS